MRPQTRAFLLIALLLFGCSISSAAEFKTGNRVTITAGDTLKSDLYAAAQVIEMFGTAQRDLVAAGQRIEMKGSLEQNFYAAGQSVIINGTVRGDILAFGAEVELSGVAASGFRGAAGSIFIKGTVNGDVIVSGGELTIAPEAVVNGDVISANGKIEVAGTVHGKLTGVADQVILAGTVDEDAELTIGKKLELRPTAHLGGNLTYRSAKPLQLENTEVVAGEIVFKEIRPKPGAAWWRWTVRIWFWLATVIVGLVMVALGKTQIQNALDRTLQRPLPTLGFGAVTLLATPIALILSFILLLTIPLGLVLLLSFLIVAYLGVIMLGTLLGREVLRLVGESSGSLYLPMFVGITLLYALTFIPRVSGLIWFVVLIGGLGMVMLGIYEGLKKSPEQAAVKQ
ncbi:MAG: polymer-forming cytoskeletal protein [candidate division KSB1 bacterium]|nr:polymer-forming cytoskeletal protein [candidate division KSB1 bacterium]MDZ7313696.1 polymer-forming cytoskeletal protein [candidate division KSB1 bacterium]